MTPDLTTIIAYLRQGAPTEMARILGPVFDAWDEMERGRPITVPNTQDFERFKIRLREIEERITDIYEEVIGSNKANGVEAKLDVDHVPSGIQEFAQQNNIPDVGQDAIGRFCEAFLRMDKEKLRSAVENRPSGGRVNRFQALLERLEDQIVERPINAYESYFKMLRMAEEVEYRPISLTPQERTSLRRMERILHGRTQLIKWILQTEGPIAKNDLEDRVRYYIPYSTLTTIMLASWLRTQPEFTVNGEGVVSLANA